MAVTAAIRAIVDARPEAAIVREGEIADLPGTLLPIPLSAPPPRRSRRDSVRLPPRRVLLGGGVAAAVLVAALLWAPWSSPGRRDWTSAPAAPVAPTSDERAWLRNLGQWVGFVRDANEDPTSLTVLDCRSRLSRLGPAPSRLHDVAALAADTCGAAAAQARDRRGSQISWDPGRAGKANEEEREADRDLRLLLQAVGARNVPDGRVVPAYSRIVSKLSGRDATARCWSSERNWEAVATSLGRTDRGLTNLAGFAVTSRSRVELAPEICRGLAEARSLPAVRVLHAVEVLTHEALHLRGPDGIADEAKTDCFAAQRMDETAALLGVRGWRRHAFASRYLRLDQLFLPARYRSPKCAANGAFDLTPGDGDWP